MLGRMLCIGAGAMGGAILRGAFDKGIMTPDQVTVCVRTEAHAAALAKEWQCTCTTTLPDVSAFDTVLLAVKPQVLPSVLPAVAKVKAGTTLISIAAGITLDALVSAVPQGAWYRAMPNTPVRVGAGLTVVTEGQGATDAVTADVEALFQAIGEVERTSEADLDRMGALSGAGPGYAFVIMDAFADAGVRIGLPRALAIRAAEQMLYGASKLALETGEHPAVLRDQVTSPGGTTIAGIAAMEKGGLRSAIQDGVVACYERSNELGKQ